MAFLYHLVLMYGHLIMFSVVSEGTTGLILEGRHNAHKGWISELRKKGDVLFTESGYLIFFSL